MFSNMVMSLRNAMGPIIASSFCMHTCCYLSLAAAAALTLLGVAGVLFVAVYPACICAVPQHSVPRLSSFNHALS